MEKDTKVKNEMLFDKTSNVMLVLTVFKSHRVTYFKILQYLESQVN